MRGHQVGGGGVVMTGLAGGMKAGCPLMQVVLPLLLLLLLMYVVLPILIRQQSGQRISLPASLCQRLCR